jgi:hypothetical protein
MWHNTRPWRLVLLLHGQRAPPATRGLARAHHAEEGKGADSFLGLTAPGAVRNGGSPRFVVSNGGESSIGGVLDVGWLQAPATCTRGR